MPGLRSRWILAAILLMGASAAASAHSYLAVPAAGAVTVIPDIGASRAAYRELTSPDQVDIYEFTARAGQEIYIQMTVPFLDRESGFAPDFVLLSADANAAPFDPPILARASLVDPPHDVVDRVHEHGVGGEPPSVGAAYGGGEPLVFDEPFTGTRYWIRQTITVPAPADGTYRIGVYSANGSLGKYVLAPGKAEKFTVGDILGLPGVRMKVREFCEQPVWPDIVFWSVLGLAALAGAGFGIYALLG